MPFNQVTKLELLVACVSHECADARMQAKKSLKVIAQQSKMDEDAIEFLHKDVSPTVSTWTGDACLLSRLPFPKHDPASNGNSIGMRHQPSVLPW